MRYAPIQESGKLSCTSVNVIIAVLLPWQKRAEHVFVNKMSMYVYHESNCTRSALIKDECSPVHHLPCAHESRALCERKHDEACGVFDAMDA